jgi:hypothetical protein
VWYSDVLVVEKKCSVRGNLNFTADPRHPLQPNKVTCTFQNEKLSKKVDFVFLVDKKKYSAAILITTPAISMETASKICSKSKCKVVLPLELPGQQYFKTCERCRNADALRRKSVAVEADDVGMDQEAAALLLPATAQTLLLGYIIIL